MFISKFKKIIVGFLVAALLATQMNIDVVRGEAAKVRYGLVAVLVSEELTEDKVLQSKVVQYAQDAQGALPNSKFLLIRVPSDAHPESIQSVLEKFYYEGDGALGEYNKLIGTVLVGDIALPVVRKGKEMFPSIYPYVDFYRKAYIYNSNRDLFVENPVDVNPVPEIWHGIIKPPVGGNEGREMLIDYFDKNHDFYLKKNDANVFDKKVFFADFYHEKKWLQNEALRGYEARMDGLELDAYSQFTGGLAKKLQDEREVRQRAEGLDVVYDTLDGTRPPADPDLAAQYESEAVQHRDPQAPQVDATDVTVPDIHSVHVIRAMWREFYEAAQKFVSETNTFVENSGRWTSTDADNPVSLISKRDKGAQRMIYGSSNAFEGAIDSIVQEIQSDIILIDQYSGTFGTTRAYVNGARVDTLQSAQDCSLFLGTYDFDGDSQLVEANRKFNPNTANIKTGYAGCHFNGNCDPDAATNPVKDLSGTEKIERVVYPDYRECLDRVTIKSIPDDASSAVFVQMSSAVKHVDPTGPVLMAQLAAGFSKYLPIDAVRYITYQAHDYSSRRLDYPTHDIWAIDDVDHQVVKNRILQILDEKNDEINESIIIGNIGSFKSYLAARVQSNFDINTAFASWRSQTLDVLRTIFTNVDSDNETKLFEAYISNIGDLTDDQKDGLKVVYDSVFGKSADPYDSILSCITGTCGGGSFEKTSHSNITTFHDFFSSGGDTVFLDKTSITISPLGIFPVQNPQERFIFRMSGLLPTNFLTRLIDDEKLNGLADAIVWKNMTIEEKHKYILEGYFGSEESYFFEPEYGYEAAYLVADGDHTFLDISVQKGYEADDDSEFSDLQDSVQSEVLDMQEEQEEAIEETLTDVRCASGSSKDGVPLFEWVPYVFCWADDSLNPPYIIYSEGEGTESSESGTSGSDSGQGTEASSLIIIPSRIKLSSDRETFIASPSSGANLTVEFFDESNDLISNFNGGSIEFVVASGEDSAQLIPGGKVSASKGKAEMKLFGTNGEGSVTVFARGTFVDEEKNEYVLESSRVTLRAIKEELRMRVFVDDDGAKKVSDEVEVGGVSGVVEVSYVDSGGEVKTDENSKRVELKISDDTYFESIETESKKLENGIIRFEFVSGERSGLLQIEALAEDGSAVVKNPFELILLSKEPASAKILSREPYLTSKQAKTFDVVLLDEFENVSAHDLYVIEIESTAGQIVESNAEGILELTILGGKATFDYRAPEVSTVQEEQISIRASGDSNSFESTFEISILPSISIELSTDKDETVIDDGEPIQITFEIKDHEGNVLNDLSTDVVFDVLQPKGGRFSDRVVEFEDGRGAVTYYSGLKAGEIEIVATHPGWSNGRYVLNILPGEPQLIELSSSEGSLNVFSDDTYPVDIILYDKAHNVVITDNETEVTVRASDLTEGLVDFETEVRVTEGVAQIQLSPKRGKAGEVHLIAESDDLISGLLAVPLKAKMTVEQLKKIELNSLYVSVMGAPIGDSTREDYLAGWLVFSGKTQALSAVSRKKNDLARVFTVGQNGFLEFDEEQDLDVRYQHDGQDRISIFNNEGDRMGDIVPVLSEIESVVVYDEGVIPETYEKGINIVPFEFPGFTYEEHEGYVEMVNDTGQVIAKVGEGFDIEIYDNIFSVTKSENVSDSLFAFDIKNGPITMATIVFDVEFPQIQLVDDLLVSDDGLYVKLNNQNLESRNIFTGSSSKGSKGLEINDTKQISEREYGFRSSGVEDIFSKPGLGWKWDYKNMLLFAAGESSGESTKHYLSDIEFLFGDPVVSLRLSSYYDRSDSEVHDDFNKDFINPAGFDRAIGELIHRDHEGIASDLVRFDFNNDGLEDVAAVFSDGTVKLMRGIAGDMPLEVLGVLLRFPDRPKYVYAGDFQRDQYDDLIALLPDGTINFQANDNKHFSNKTIDLGIENITGFSVANMNKDSYLDLVVSDNKGDIYIAYGSNEGFKNNSKIGGLGIQIDSSQELNATTYVYYPGMQEPQYGTYACDGVSSPSCDAKSYRESSYIPEYVRNQYDPSNEGVTAEGAFAESTSGSQAGISYSPETEELFESFSDLVAEQLDDSAAESFVPSYVYYLKGSVDDNLAITKHVALQNGTSGQLDPDDPLRFTINVRNDSNHTISNFSFADVLPSVYELKPNSVECEDCLDVDGNKLVPDTNVDGYSFIYDSLKLQPGGEIEIIYDAFAVNIPGLMFIVGHFDVDSGLRPAEDNYLDLQVKPEGSASEAVIYFVSQNNGASYEMRVVTPPGIEQPAVVDEIRDRAGKTPAEFQQEAQGVMDSFSEDDDNDGIPNIFDIALRSFSSFFSSKMILVQKAYAQDYGPFDEEAGQIDHVALVAAGDGVTAGLDATSDEVAGSAEAVEGALKGFTCAGGCLAMPVNVALFSPGMWNALGAPSGFDDGTALFSLVPPPTYITLGSNPASYFRFYVSPTLTLGLGLGFCLGSYLSGQCLTVSVPVSALMGDFCEDLNGDIGAISSGVTNFKYDALNETDLGVVSVDASAGNSSQMDDDTLGMEYGISALGAPASSTEQTSSNRRLPSSPPFFANWFDKQWEEITNSFYDFSDVILYYPDFEEIWSSKTRHQRNALAAQLNSIETWDGVVEFMKNMPMIDLKVEKIVIKLPVLFEPDIWDKIEADLKSWWLSFLGETVDFLDSFRDISCGTLDVGSWVGLREALIEKKKVDPDDDSNSGLLPSYIEEFQSSDDISTQISAFRKVLEYYEKNFGEKWGKELQGRGDDSSQQQAVDDQSRQMQEGMEERTEEIKESTAKDISQCLVGKFGIDALSDITKLISSLEENYRVLQEYRKFPRQIVKYYDLLGNYIGDVSNFVDKAFVQLSDWMSKNVDRLLLWVKSAYTFEEYIVMWQGLAKLFEDYKSECSLCQSDRFTLKDFILKLFVVLPEIPVIPFPNWPDLILDFSDLQMGIPITLPVFDIVFDGGINWPGLPRIELPKLNELGLDINIGANLGAQFTLPGIPVLPPPPDLPDIGALFKLPEFPELRLPVAPLPPKLPDLFDWIMPVMDMVEVFMKIVCLLNQSLIPIEEMKLKTQIENLTARSNDLLLPLDLFTALDAKPQDIAGSFPDFLKFKTRIEIVPQLYKANNNVLIQLLRDIANTWNNVFVNFFAQINEKTAETSESLSELSRSATKAMQSQTDSVRLDVDVDIDLNEYTSALFDKDRYKDKKLLFDKKIQKKVASLDLDTFVTSELQRKLISLKSELRDYQEYVQMMRDETKLVANLQKQPALENLYSLASSVTTSGGVSLPKKETVSGDDVEIVEKRISLLNKKLLPGKLITQASPGAPAGAGGGGASPGLVLNGLYIMHDDRMYQLTKYDDEASEEGDVLIYDFDNDGDADVLYSLSSDIYLKRSENSSKVSQYYPQVPNIKNLEDFAPQNKAVNMFRPLGDRSQKSTIGWLSDDKMPYHVAVKDTIDGFEYFGDTKSFFVTNDDDTDSRITYYDDYLIVEKVGDVKISSLNADSSVIHPDDVVEVPDRGKLVIEIAPEILVEIGPGAKVKIPSFATHDLRVTRGRVVINGSAEVLFGGYKVETEDGEVVFKIDKYRLTVPEQSSVDIPPMERSPMIFLGFDGDVRINSKARSLCMAREECEISSGDFVHALFDVSLEIDDFELPLKQGYGFAVDKDSKIKVTSGVVEIIHQRKEENIIPYYGMKIFPGDTFSVHSSFHILHKGREYFFREGTVKMISVSDTDSITESVPLPNSYHYGQIIQYNSLADSGTYSAIEHFSPHEEDIDPLFVNDPIEEEIAIFARRTISAEPYLELASSDQVFWDLDLNEDGDGDGDLSNDRDVEGMNYEFGPYHTVGVHEVTINVVRPNGQLIQKPVSLIIFVPEISLSEISFSSGQLKGKIDPSISSYPVSVVRERTNIMEILTLEAAEGFDGPDEYKKYYTDSSGTFALEPFDLTKGHRILDNDGNEIVRILEENGRVITNASLADKYRLKVYPSTNDLPLRISVLTRDDLVVASVYFVPEVDSDVFVDDYLTEYSRDNVKTMNGVHVKTVGSNYDAENIPGDAGFYPGGAVIKDATGTPIAYISSGGDVNFARDGLSLRVKFTFDDLDPVIFELLNNNDVVAELFISGDFSELQEIGAGSIGIGDKYFDSNGNGILDTWERVYGFTGDSQEIASGDPDRDTLTNLEEYKAGTNPYLADTDRDGISDDVEVRGEGDALSEFAAEHRFNDVLKNSPYFQAVQRLYREGIIKGFEDNTYRPNQPIRRAELIKIILGTTSCESCVNPSDETREEYNPTKNNPDLLKFNDIGVSGNTRTLAYDVNVAPTDRIIHYPDVLLRDWFYYCVEIATEMGIVHGYKGEDDSGRNATGLFLPLENISRAEAVKVFLEAADFSILSSRVIFDEVDEGGNNISEGWYYGPELNYIFTAVELGLLEPDANGRVYPEKKITRGEMAEMALKVLNKLIERFQYEDFDGDEIQNMDDACICLEEDYDQLDDEDGCPEGATQFVEIPSVELPKDTGIYIVKGENLCQFVEPIADAVDGDIFYAIISDFENDKVWRKSNELIWREK